MSQKKSSGNPGQEQNNSPSKSNESRRKVLKSTLAGGAVITTSILPDKWSRPAIDAVLLPSHAATTDSGTDPGGGTDPDGGTDPGGGTTTAAPLLSFFGDVTQAFGKVDSDDLMSRIAGLMGDAVAPEAHALLPLVSPKLCINQTSATQVDIRYASPFTYVVGDSLTLGDGDGIFYQWIGNGSLNIPISLFPNCPGVVLPIMSITVGNPIPGNPARIPYMLMGISDTIPEGQWQTYECPPFNPNMTQQI